MIQILALTLSLLSVPVTTLADNICREVHQVLQESITDGLLTHKEAGAITIRCITTDTLTPYQ